MDQSCIFCSIINHENSAHIVYENAHSIAFLDTNPSAEGHTLVIHKKHGQTILDYREDELKEVLITVQKVLRALEFVCKTKTFTIGINHGEISGIHHMHIHIIPHAKNSYGRIIQSLVRGNINEDLSYIQNKIKKELQKNV